jgi:hypothetical protein
VVGIEESVEAAQVVLAIYKPQPFPRWTQETYRLIQKKRNKNLSLKNILDHGIYRLNPSQMKKRYIKSIPRDWKWVG